MDFALMFEISTSLPNSVSSHLQMRRELLRTHDLTSRMARELESTSDWFLCARKIARLCVPTLGCASILDVLKPGGNTLERVAYARAGNVFSTRFEQLRKHSWSEQARLDLETQCSASGALELRSGPALREIKRVIKSENPETLESAFVLPLSFRGRSMGFMTLLRTSRSNSGSRKDLNDIPFRAYSELAELIGNALGSRQEMEILRSEISQMNLFFSAATHDLKVPLTTLMLHLDLLRLKLEMNIPAEARQELDTGSLDMIQKALDKLTEGVQGLYDCSQISSGNFKLKRVEMNLGKLVEELLQTHGPLFSSSGNTIHSRIAPNVVGNWDPFQLSRVFNNLIHNANKYAPRSLIEISVSSRDSKAVLRVRDHGPGIQKTDLTRVFDSFYRGEKDRGAVEGLGLGLFICKGIVEAHGGTVRVRKPKDRGTEFVVQLPLHLPAHEGSQRVTK